MAKCNRLTPLPFKGLTYLTQYSLGITVHEMLMFLISVFSIDFRFSDHRVTYVIPRVLFYGEK